MAAELLGLRDGLILANNLNIRKLYIEIDAKAMITILTYALFLFIYIFFVVVVVVDNKETIAFLD